MRNFVIKKSHVTGDAKIRKLVSYADVSRYGFVDARFCALGENNNIYLSKSGEKFQKRDNQDTQDIQDIVYSEVYYNAIRKDNTAGHIAFWRREGTGQYNRKYNRLISSIRKKKFSITSFCSNDDIVVALTDDGKIILAYQYDIPDIHYRDGIRVGIDRKNYRSLGDDGFIVRPGTFTSSNGGEVNRVFALNRTTICLTFENSNEIQVLNGLVDYGTIKLDSTVTFVEDSSHPVVITESGKVYQMSRAGGGIREIPLPPSHMASMRGYVLSAITHSGKIILGKKGVAEDRGTVIKSVEIPLPSNALSLHVFSHDGYEPGALVHLDNGNIFHII